MSSFNDSLRRAIGYLALGRTASGGGGMAFTVSDLAGKSGHRWEETEAALAKLVQDGMMESPSSGRYKPTSEGWDWVEGKKAKRASKASKFGTWPYSKSPGAREAGPYGAFLTAAKKIEKQIALIADGTFEHDEIRKVSVAINKLDDRTNKPEIRGDEAIREKAWALVSDLRRRKVEAEEVGLHARQARRYREIASITGREREHIANMTPSERATWQYQQELKLLRR